MSEYTLETAYRVAYWRKNELQLIACGFESNAINEEISKLERFQSRICNSLGYMPSA